jgi:hypothetical protein
MEKLSFRTCLIFNPNLKPNKKKPSDEEKQDAKLLIYYPSCDEIMAKRSNMGIIEGTIQFNHSFNDMNEKEKSQKYKNKIEFLIAELNSTFYFTQKFENKYYISIIIEKKYKSLNLNENVNHRASIFKEILTNFYNYFYLFHGTFDDIFFPNGKDIRDNESLYTNIQTTFSDFITCYFDFIGDFDTNKIYQSPILDGILYSATSAYPNLLFASLRLYEKYKDIKATSLVYKGFLLHNEIDIEAMSLLYNMFFNNLNGEDFLDKFRYPNISDEKNKNNEKKYIDGSPFLKAFRKKEDNETNNYLIGCDLSNKNGVFMPFLHLKNGTKIKYMIYNIKDLYIFLFFDENFEIKGKDLFAQMASFLDECFTQNLEDLNKVNFEDKIKETKKDFEFVYYNKENKSLKLSSIFYVKNKNELDKTKIPILEKIKELILSKRIKKSVTKFDEKYIYYFEYFQKNVAIIIKEKKSIDEVKVKYLNKLLKTIEYY